MDFLDIFDNGDKSPIKIESINIIDRKRKLDDFLESYVEEAENLEEKKFKVDLLEFKNPINDIVLKTITTKNCTHEVVYPKCLVYEPLKTAEISAKTFQFTLDAFQNQAIQCIENNQSLLVSAHTSAGKTVCASYTIALCIKEKRRVIYTTPIKALSNQKYREFKEEFEDVGLLTGDVTKDQNATVLIMTTEILRLMLLRNSSVIKEVGWVIFDEIHYMRDQCRGVVWEESIILLPDSMRLLFLSATIPNARQFAQWISHIHGQPCNVIYTDYRPTPLQHYIYPHGSDRIYQVVNETGEFLHANFLESMAVLTSCTEKAAPVPKRWGKKALETHCKTLILKVFELKNDPVIVFSFSKSLCEEYARMLDGLDYTSESEKRNIQLIFANARNTLPEEDRNMAQLDCMLGLVKRGIGIHHGGLLPVLKEIVEILFGEGLIKCLFATETFSMGLNMPAKTVIFTSAMKFDGITVRQVTSGEYIQMSGRAGRRGLDTNGNVILMIDRTWESSDVKQLISGESEPLNSSFHLTYNMILNLMRTSTINPEYLMEHSFLQFQNFCLLPVLMSTLEQKEKQLREIAISKEDYESVTHYCRLERSLTAVREEMWHRTRREHLFRPFLTPGRLIHVKYTDKDFGWCIVLSKLQCGRSQSFFVDCLVPVAHESIFVEELSMALPPPRHNNRPDGIYIPVQLQYIFELSQTVLDCNKTLTKTLENNYEARQNFLIKRKTGPGYLNSIPMLDLRLDLKCRPAGLEAFEPKMQEIQISLENHPIRKNPQFEQLMNLYLTKLEVKSNIDQLTDAVSARIELIKMNELKSRKRVLRQFKFANDSDVIQTKGRVACEISTGDELMLTEMMLGGELSNLTNEQLAAFLSCFVFEEKVVKMITPQADLTNSLAKMRELARHICRVSKECRLSVYPLNEEAVYVSTFKIGLVEIVRAWCKGSTFSKLCENTTVYEGSIIRCIRRLDELLGQLYEAARVIGNIQLEKKFCEASNLIKRGIIFSSSLYLAIGN